MPLKGDIPGIGFVIGFLFGFILIWRGAPYRGRDYFGGLWFFMLICGGIGFAVQVAVVWLAGLACTRGLAPPEMVPAGIGAVVGILIGIAAVIVQVEDLAFDKTRVNPMMVIFLFGCGGVGMGAGLFLASLSGEICRHWH